MFTLRFLVTVVHYVSTVLALSRRLACLRHSELTIQSDMKQQRRSMCDLFAYNTDSYEITIYVNFR
jgi:hypothetical protein